MSAQATQPQIAISEDENNTIAASIPKVLMHADALDTMKVQLHELRNRIDALEIQAYGMKIAKLFSDNPWIIEVELSNTDDPSDNGRHIYFEVSEIDDEQLPDGEPDPWTVAENLCDELREELNDTIRHRGLYDYIDEVIDLGTLRRDTVDTQLGHAYDEVFSVGDWQGLNALRQAISLGHSTPKRTGSRRVGRA